MADDKPETLSIKFLKRAGAFAGMTKGQALVFRFCDDVFNGNQPSKEDMHALATALLPITKPDDNTTDQIMAEVAKNLGLTRKQGQEKSAERDYLKHASLVAEYFLRVEKLIEGGKTKKAAELETRSFYAKKLGIGDRAMREKIKKHKIFAQHILPLYREN